MEEYGRKKSIVDHPNVEKKKRGGGRPPLGKYSRKTERIVVMMNALQRDTILFRALCEGKRPGVWARDTLLAAARGTAKPPLYRITNEHVRLWRQGKLLTPPIDKK